jgi:transcriptional regulator GlxA family with amidase domain
MPALQNGYHSEGVNMNTRLNHVQDWLELARQANWSAAALAKKCGVSLRTLERHFLKEMGKCPQAWLSEQRQRRAIELLQDGSTVKETAGSLGYKYATHFSREFKEQWGHCPSTISALLKAEEGRCRDLV